MGQFVKGAKKETGQTSLAVSEALRDAIREKFLTSKKAAHASPSLPHIPPKLTPLLWHWCCAFVHGSSSKSSSSSSLLPLSPTPVQAVPFQTSGNQPLSTQQNYNNSCWENLCVLSLPREYSLLFQDLHPNFQTSACQRTTVQSAEASHT